MLHLALTLAAVCSAPQEPEPPQLSPTALRAWSEHLAPTDDEDRCLEESPSRAPKEREHGVLKSITTRPHCRR